MDQRYFIPLGIFAILAVRFIIRLVWHDGYVKGQQDALDGKINIQK